MPVNNPFAPSAFQAPPPQQGVGNILSPSTIRASQGQSGTPFDILSRYASSIEARRSDEARQQLEAQRHKENQDAAQEALILEAQRFETGQEGKAAAAKAKVDAAEVKRVHEVELKRLDEENKQKVAGAKRDLEQRKIAVLVSQYPEELGGIDFSEHTLSEVRRYAPGKDGKVAPRIGLSTRTGVVEKIKDGTFGGGDPLKEMEEEQQNKLANAISTRANELQEKFKVSQEKSELFAYQELVEGTNPTGTLELGEEDATWWFDKPASFTPAKLITTQKEYDALESGTKFVDSEGNKGTKP